MSKKEQVLEFIKQKGEARTSEVIRFSSSIYHNRGDRDCRELAEAGRLRRMDDWNKKMKYGETKEDIWVFVKKSLTKIMKSGILKG